MAKHICSGKLWFIVASLDPMVHCVYNVRLDFISYNGFWGIRLPKEYNEEHFIIVNIVIYRMLHCSHNPFEMNAGIKYISVAMLLSTHLIDERRVFLYCGGFLNSELCL